MFPAAFHLLPASHFQLLAEFPLMLYPVLILLGVVLCWLLNRLAIASHKKTIAAWRQAAEELGISFTGTQRLVKPSMEGRVAGFQVKVHAYTQSSGQSSTTYTDFRVSFPGSLDMGLKLSRELALVSGITKFFGAQDILSGDEVFDTTFVIKGTEPDDVIGFLTEDIRRQLIELQQAQKGMGIVVTDIDISVTQMGVARDGDAIITLVTSLTHMAFVLDGHLASSEDLA